MSQSRNERSPRIVVATHRRAEMPRDDLYLPVHVGSALGAEQLPYARDDQGESLSERNARYCELTGLYWAWQNLQPGPLGLAHYRRYFAGAAPGPRGSAVLGTTQAAELLDRVDIVVARPRRYWVETVESHYGNAHVAADLAVTGSVVSSGGPAMADAWRTVLERRWMSPFNMFVARGAVADDYCGWLFATLAETEPLLGVEERDAYQTRALGFLGERLLNVWVEAHPSLRVHRLRVVHTEGDPVLSKGLRMVARKVSGSPGSR